MAPFESHRAASDVELAGNNRYSDLVGDSSQRESERVARDSLSGRRKVCFKVSKRAGR